MPNTPQQILTRLEQFIAAIMADDDGSWDAFDGLIALADSIGITRGEIDAAKSWATVRTMFQGRLNGS
jgi:hypothetical protein